MRKFVPIAAKAAAFLLVLASPAALAAQDPTGNMSGRVTSGNDPVAGVTVTIEGTALTAVTDNFGRYLLTRVPPGTHSVNFRRLGYSPLTLTASVAGGEVVLDAVMEQQALMMGNIVVEGASRAPERVVEAPAAISIVDPEVVQSTSVTSQAPLVIATVPGMDVVQNGMNDFNVNSRGFNSSLNRRILVLQDGRDLATGFLGNQEWNALALPLEDLSNIEVIRGPGSALYGANAFSGVINITTPLAREVRGTKLSIGGGELSTLRADIRHAGVSRDSRLGYRINAGFNQSDSWSISRTSFTGIPDIVNEYAEVTDVPVTPGSQQAEVVPLSGDEINPANGNPIGSPDVNRTIYGSARLDYYQDNGSVATVEGGFAQGENMVAVTGIGRVQVQQAQRPWVRLNYAADRFNLMAWFSGRESTEPQVSLRSGLPLEESSQIYHIEGQTNQEIAGGRGRFVLGGSFRSTHLNTEATLMAPSNDDRTDKYYSAYSQFEYELTPELRFVGAARFDDGDLFDPQFSPKGALVFSPAREHAIRFTVNRAFQTPNYSEFFLRVPVAQPSTSPAALEQALEGYFTTVEASLGAGVADLNLPTSIPWNFNDTTFASALGNAALDVETVVSFELGYKGNVTDRLFVGVDVYLSKLKNFVTDLLPGVNPLFPRYFLTDGVDIANDLQVLDARLASLGLPATHPLRTANASLRGNYAGLSSLVGNLLATNPDGSRAIVVSYGNAGEVTERGIEVSAGLAITDEIRVAANYSFFDFDVESGSAAAGDQLLPNTPKNKGGASVNYTGRNGMDLGVNAQFVQSHDWAAGVFDGFIPARQIVNVSAGYRVNANLRLSLIATNVLNQKRYHLYGGSVIGRRLLGSVTATF